MLTVKEATEVCKLPLSELIKDSLVALKGLDREKYDIDTDFYIGKVDGNFRISLGTVLFKDLIECFLAYPSCKWIPRKLPEEPVEWEEVRPVFSNLPTEINMRIRWIDKFQDALLQSNIGLSGSYWNLGFEIAENKKIKRALDKCVGTTKQCRYKTFPPRKKIIHYVGQGRIRIDNVIEKKKNLELSFVDSKVKEILDKGKQGGSKKRNYDKALQD